MKYLKQKTFRNIKSKIGLVIFLSFLFTNLIVKGQVGVGTKTPHASSILELKSSNKGLLIPRMTEANRLAILNPAEGLMVYQTNGIRGFYIRNATKWTRLIDEEKVYFEDGSAASPSISFASDPSFGFFKGGNSLFLANFGDTAFQINPYDGNGNTVFKGFGTNRLSLNSNSALIQIAHGNRFEFAGGRFGDIFFIGYHHSSSNGRAIVVTSSVTKPVVPFAIKGSGTNVLQEWRNKFSQVLTYVDASGNLVFNHSGIINDESASNANSGNAKLNNGSVQISNTSIDSKSRIFVSNNGVSGTPGTLYVVKQNNIGFQIRSTSTTDNSDVSWFIIRAK